jgi:hypothetical protein
MRPFVQGTCRAVWNRAMGGIAVMEPPRTPASHVAALVAISLVVAIVAITLAACGGSDTAPTDLPTRTTPIAAYALSAQESLPETDYARETDGLEFVPWVDIEVTALGYYDAGGDGLVNEHTVGIFEKSSRQLVSDTVTVDGGSTLEDAFRYEDITPVVLKGGTAYVLAGSTHAPYDLMVGGTGTDAAWAPELRYVTYCFVLGEFAFPRRTQAIHLENVFTANFMFRSPSSAGPAATP